MDFAAGKMQVLGDLTAGLAAADYQHGTVRQRAGVAIERRMNLHDVGGQPLGTARHDRDLITAGREHHLIGEVNSVGRIEHETVLGVAAQMTHRYAFQ